MTEEEREEERERECGFQGFYTKYKDNSIVTINTNKPFKVIRAELKRVYKFPALI